MRHSIKNRSMMKNVTVHIQLFCLVLTSVSLHGMEQPTELSTSNTQVKPIPIPRMQGNAHTIVIREYTKSALINLSALPKREQEKVLHEQIGRAKMLSHLYASVHRIDETVREAVDYWNDEQVLCSAKLRALETKQEPALSKEEILHTATSTIEESQEGPDQISTTPTAPTGRYCSIL